jgi:hypothetical protein
MRRAIVLATLVGSAPGVVIAAPWSVTGEAGSELDSNVQRVETGGDLMTEEISAWVMRFGARVERKGKLAGGNLVFNLSDLTRVVAQSEGSQDVSVENIAVLAGNVRWLHQIGDRPVVAGFALGAIDALPLSDGIGARTFRNLGADAVIGLRTEDEHELTMTVGGRDFTYKPNHEYDYRGPAVGARLELMLWQPAAKTKSLELATTIGFENRTYEDVAAAHGCPIDAPPAPNCFAPTDIERRDRYQRLGLELTWVGNQVAALGYQLTLIDSNSYGESLARQRISLSGTAQLPGNIYGTLLAILQIDQYLDGLPVSRDPQMQEYTNVEDENRSSLQLRLARKLAGQWSVEIRAAIWRDLFGGAPDRDFSRELVYLGLVYGK